MRVFNSMVDLQTVIVTAGAGRPPVCLALAADHSVIPTRPQSIRQSVTWLVCQCSPDPWALMEERKDFWDVIRTSLVLSDVLKAAASSPPQTFKILFSDLPMVFQMPRLRTEYFVPPEPGQCLRSDDNPDTSHTRMQHASHSIIMCRIKC